MKRKIQHITGRRWFQKSAGNTYHTATLHFDNGDVKTSPITYGYGDQYLDTAFKMLGIEGQAGTLRCREELGITYSVSDVSRKKDL